MFHNLNPGHFFSSCTHTGIHMASDWLWLSKPWPVIGPGVAWQMSHTSHDTMAAWHTALPVPPSPPPSSISLTILAQGKGWHPHPLLANMNIIALSQLIVFRPLPGWESVRNIHRSNLVKICNHHTKYFTTMLCCCRSSKCGNIYLSPFMDTYYIFILVKSTKVF